MSDEPKGPQKIDLRAILDEAAAGDVGEVEVLDPALPAEAPAEEEPEAPAPEEEPAEAEDAAPGEEASIEERHLRLRAEFDNYRKRKEREMTEYRRRAAADLIAVLLPVLDNLDRALAGAPDPDDPLRQGVDLIHRQLWEALEREGLQRVPAVGHPFDPEVHQAVSAEACDDLPPNTVREELQRGYRFQGRLLRPAIVRVSLRPGPDESASAGSGPAGEE